MANDKVAIWNQTLKLARPPANGELLIGNGADFNLAALTAGSNVTITNTAGGISIASTNPGGTVTGVTASSPLASSGGTAPDISLSGTVAVGNGGTGATTLAANNVILGNGTSAVQLVAPGANGNILTSNGTTWTSATPTPQTWTTVKKTSGQTISLSATLTDDNTLQFAMAANKTYAIRISLVFSFTTGGYQYGITGPASPTAVRWGTSNAYGLIASGGTTGQQITWLPVMVQNGANAGNFKVQFCQSSGAAGSITMEAGAYLEYMEIV